MAWAAAGYPASSAEPPESSLLPRSTGTATRAPIRGHRNPQAPARTQRGTAAANMAAAICTDRGASEKSSLAGSPKQPALVDGEVIRPGVDASQLLAALHEQVVEQA